MQTDTIDDDDRVAAFSDLAMMKSLDWNRLRSRITERTASGPIRLAALVDDKQGNDAVDVMGLIQIAHEDEHRINPSVRDRIRVRLKDQTVVELDVPEVIYSRRIAPPIRSRKPTAECSDDNNGESSI